MRLNIVWQKETSLAVVNEWDIDIVLGIMSGARKGGMFGSPLRTAVRGSVNL